jgi:uncharacterized membrane protein
MDRNERSRRMTDVANHVDGSIDSVSQLERQAEANVSHPQRLIERITTGLGRSWFVLGVVLVMLAWIVGNGIVAAVGGRPIDAPPFYWLATATSTAGFTATLLILATQNRQARLADRRARLDFQINLLTEQKVAKIIELIEELRRDSPEIPNRHDLEAVTLSLATDPHDIVRRLDEEGVTGSEP